MGAPLIFATDTETGGLLCEKHDLLTFYGAIVTDDLVLVEDLYLKLKPDNGRLPNVEAKALEVNGIDIHKHLADPETVTYSEGAKLLKALLKRHLSKNGRYSNLTPMIFNASFDEGFIKKYLLSDEEWQSTLHYDGIDPKKEVSFLKRCGLVPKDVGTLVSSADFFGVPKRPAHDAKNDTWMMIELHGKMISVIKSKQGGGESSDLISLLEAE